MVFKAVLLLLLAPLVVAKCPTGYHIHNYQLAGSNKQVCMKFIESVNREDAFNMCKRDGADLPEPNTAELNNLYKEYEIDHWLGFTCSSNPSTNQCLLDGASNGADSPQNGTCVYADGDGVWHNADCFNYLADAICTFVDSGNFNGGCYDGYAQQGTACYRYVNVAASFLGASASCQSQMAQLTDIASAEENAFIRSMISNTPGGAGATAWIGLFRDFNNSTFTWKNWAPPVYTNFEVKPSPIGYSECYVMQPTGLWAPKPVANSAGFVCKHALSGH